MLFNILPTPGSSGAPLVDEHGAVVGMALGTRMDNRVEGNRGWGIPAELIYEVKLGLDGCTLCSLIQVLTRCSVFLDSSSTKNNFEKCFGIARLFLVQAEKMYEYYRPRRNCSLNPIRLPNARKPFPRIRARALLLVFAMLLKIAGSEQTLGCTAAEILTGR